MCVRDCSSSNGDTECASDGTSVALRQTLLCLLRESTASNCVGIPCESPKFGKEHQLKSRYNQPQWRKRPACGPRLDVSRKNTKIIHFNRMKLRSAAGMLIQMAQRAILVSSCRTCKQYPARSEAMVKHERREEQPLSLEYQNNLADWRNDVTMLRQTDSGQVSDDDISCDIRYRRNHPKMLTLLRGLGASFDRRCSHSMWATGTFQPDFEQY